jgi:hypothetical protein
MNDYGDIARLIIFLSRISQAKREEISSIAVLYLYTQAKGSVCEIDKREFRLRLRTFLGA